MPATSPVSSTTPQPQLGQTGAPQTNEPRRSSVSSQPSAEATGGLESRAAGKARATGAATAGAGTGEAAAAGDENSPRWTVLKYLNDTSIPKKTLVVGCGSTPSQVMMGKMQGVDCSRGKDHAKDFTIDVSPKARADLTMDLVMFNSSDLGNYGAGKFNSVEFEYLNRGPRDRFSDKHVDAWINGADALLSKQGEITFFSGDKQYIAFARASMEKRGYTVTDHAVEGDGTPGNKHGHRFCVGVKPDPQPKDFMSWLRG